MSHIQYVNNDQSEVTKILVESLEVKEYEKLHIELISRQNIFPFDIMGLSWIFIEDDYS